MRLVVMMLALVIAVPAATARPDGRVPVDRREAIKKKIRALRAYTLTEELKLDENTAGKLFPLLAKWDDVTDKLLGQRADLTRQLAASDSIKDPKVLDKVIDGAIANQRAFWELEDKRLAELRKVLSPAQIAKLLIVLPTFERQIQRQLRKAIQRHKAPVMAPDDDVDDDVEPGEQPARPAAKPSETRAPGQVPPSPKCDPFNTRYGCTR